IDVHGGAFKRNTYMLTDERARLGKRLHRPIDVNPAVGQLTRALACVDKDSADPAVDVDPGIAFRGAGCIRQPIELVLVLREHLRKRLEQRRALVERELTQARSADVARVLERRAEVDAIR